MGELMPASDFQRGTWHQRLKLQVLHDGEGGGGGGYRGGGGGG
jgi:hypothetical protein